ncbi:hypothetical protein B484DRAFT_458038 [Ochromonadaceae sp. CCMP2298]|nr:hypothetical protein B484DRAFT_458038 [Ochromonadaceae sp. CCMP2298]|mmetsp:Transcript_14229/g.31409  ORF Transcript_14229/g.31409 Transcript_14229/m.31409 type:complete len:321 (-) Transcript_14229:89-1051(-)
MSSSAGRLILNEILNSDYRDLHERIDSNPGAVEEVGVCGESPSHIAIYKNDLQMLRILLDAGANPNMANDEGDALTHAAARLGYLPLLELLYETKRCKLTAKNNLGQTALDVARSQVQEADLAVTKLFATYTSATVDEEGTRLRVVEGRRGCAALLAQKMEIDRAEKVHNMVESTMVDMKSRRRTMMAVRGAGGHKYTTFYADINYHKRITEVPWESIDLQFFTSYKPGLDYVLRTVFVCDFVSKSQHVGMHNALTRLASKRAASEFPAPVALGTLKPPLPLITDKGPRFPAALRGRSAQDGRVAGQGALSVLVPGRARR